MTDPANRLSALQTAKQPVRQPKAFGRLVREGSQKYVRLVQLTFCGQDERADKAGPLSGPSKGL